MLLILRKRHLWHRHLHLITTLIVVPVLVRRCLMLLLVLALLLIRVLIGVHTATTSILISLLVRRHHILATIVIGSTSVHAGGKIGSSTCVIGLTSFVVVATTTTILLLLTLERLLATVEVSSWLELLRLQVGWLGLVWSSCVVASWKWLLLALEGLVLRLLLRLLLLCRGLERRCSGRE